LIAAVAVPASAVAADTYCPLIWLATDSHRAICEQVIACGTKDGERREYPTPCDARDDGATDISAKTGGTCATPPPPTRQPSGDGRSG
jgi:hypothetical protein